MASFHSVGTIAGRFWFFLSATMTLIIAPLWLTPPAHAEFVRVGEFSAYRTMDGRKGAGVVFFNTKTNSATIAFYDIIFDPISFTLTAEQIPMLTKAITKYTTWMNTAIQSKEKVEKEITAINNVQAHFFNAEEYYNAGAKNTVTLTFKSYTTEKHFLILSLSPLQAIDDSTVATQPKALYLEIGGASFLSSYVSDPDVLEQAVQRHTMEQTQQQEIEQKYQ